MESKELGIDTHKLSLFHAHTHTHTHTHTHFTVFLCHSVCNACKYNICKSYTHTHTMYTVISQIFWTFLCFISFSASNLQMRWLLLISSLKSHHSAHANH